MSPQAWISARLRRGIVLQQRVSRLEFIAPFRQQYYTPRWHLCRRRIHNRDKHALGSTSLSVPRYHSYCIFVWCCVVKLVVAIRVDIWTTHTRESSKPGTKPQFIYIVPEFQMLEPFGDILLRIRGDIYIYIPKLTTIYNPRDQLHSISVIYRILFSEPASHPKAKALGFPGRNQ